MLQVKVPYRALAKQVDAFAEKISAIDMDSAVAVALDEVADYLLAYMQQLLAASGHIRSGDAYRALRRTPVEKEGNRYWVEVGAMRIRYEDKSGFHIVYLEHGSTHAGGWQTLEGIHWLEQAKKQTKAMNGIIENVLMRYTAEGGGA